MFDAKKENFTFAGNEQLIIGTLTVDGKVSNAVQGRGLISVGAMENQSEAETHYADNEIWSTSKGAPLLQGSLSFIQLSDEFRVDFFGQQDVTATVGSLTVSGYADTGVYPSRILQYLTPGTVTMDDGTVEDAALLTVFPNAQVISAPQKETETTGDGTTVVTWSADIQATATEKYAVNGKPQPVYEYFVKGDAEVAKLKQELKNGSFAIPTSASVGTKAAPKTDAGK